MVTHLFPLKKELERLREYKAGKPIEEVKRELGLETIIKLASNENPFGCSPKVQEALQEAFIQLAKYPETTAPELSLRLSQKWGLTPEHFVIGNGSDEIIRLMAKCFIQQGDEAIMADGTFPRYETCVYMEGGKPVKIPLIQGVHDLEAMQNAINSKTRMVFICNPNNPTGTIVSKQRLQTFIEHVPKNVLLVIDEAYYEYMDDEVKLDTHRFVEKYPNLVVLRTFSKIYGLASLRIGYGIMNPQIRSILLKVKDPFNSNRFAQKAALCALEDWQFVESCKQKNQEGLTFLQNEFDRMGISYFSSHANFLMILLHESGTSVAEKLVRDGIIVRAGEVLGFPNTIRVTIGTESENHRFMDAFKQIMKGANEDEN
ncbi:histidinol-phosphate transaminase [Bacillus kexueae]|uniref:histidinol-phosphate transaminase n=1 Tax=Aeribacillus kexueae TaxID=2078952 RepID=UPI001FAF391F|nr:histidinol-phosphate transaminase [Bacillus kexueae]